MQPQAERSAMSVKDIADAFTTALKAHDYATANAFWSDHVVSIEAMDGPMKETRGRAAVQGKSDWWNANHDVHSFETIGPYMNGDAFAVRFIADVTFKVDGSRRKIDEVGVYTVRDGEIVEERFFY